VINVDAPLSHALFDFTVTEFISNVIANNLEDDVGRKVATGKVERQSQKPQDLTSTSLRARYDLQKGRDKPVPLMALSLQEINVKLI